MVAQPVRQRSPLSAQRIACVGFVRNEARIARRNFHSKPEREQEPGVVIGDVHIPRHQVLPKRLSGIVDHLSRGSYRFHPGRLYIRQICPDAIRNERAVIDVEEVAGHRLDS